MATFTDQILVLQADGVYKKLEAGDTLELSTGSLIVGGNLTVAGTKVTNEAETVLVADNHTYVNAGYTTAAAQTGGLIVNYLPTATVDSTTGAGVFTPGINATSDPTVTTAAASVFSASDLVQISGSDNSGENNGLYEVLSHSGNLLTIRSTADGITNQVEDFTDGQFIANAGDTGASITKVTVSVLRSGTDGIWESGFGSVTGFTFSDHGTTASSTLQAAYISGNSIITNATDGDFDISGTEGISMDASAASNLTVAGSSLTLETTTSGTLNVSGAGVVDVSAVGNLVMTSSDSITMDAQGAAGIISGTLGTDTSATSFGINNNSASPLFVIDGSGQADFTGNIDATGGIDIDSDSAALTLGADADISMQWDGVDMDVTVLVDDSIWNWGTQATTIDMVWNGGPTLSTLTFDASVGGWYFENQFIQMGDDDPITLGDSGAFELVNNGTNSIISEYSGNDLIIDVTGSTGSMISRLGSDTSSTSFQVQNNSESAIFTVNGSGQVDATGNIDASGGVDIDADNASLTIGASSDWSILHNSVDTIMTSSTGDYIMDNISATGSTIVRLGSDTTATDFQVQNNSETASFTITGDGEVRVLSGLHMNEQGSPPSVSAGISVFWSRDDAPTVGMFTDDEATSYNLLSWSPEKRPCRLATTGDVANMASAAPDTVDGVALAIGDRILVWKQDDLDEDLENGIYVVTTVGTGANGVWVRAADFDNAPDDHIEAGISVYIQEGDTNGLVDFRLVTPGTLIIDTTALKFIPGRAHLRSDTSETVDQTGTTFTATQATAVYSAAISMNDYDDIDVFIEVNSIATITTLTVFAETTGVSGAPASTDWAVLQSDDAITSGAVVLGDYLPQEGTAAVATFHWNFPARGTQMRIGVFADAAADTFDLKYKRNVRS
jgi:hypothetical protein